MHRKLRNFAGYTVFLDPKHFAEAAGDYFEWCDEHPLLEEVVSFHQGSECRADKPKMRAYTKQGLANHIGIPVSRLELYKSRGGMWEEVVEIIENVLYQQKFEGAAAGLLNAGLISRDLDLAEKSELSGPGGKAIQTEDTTQRDAELFTSSIIGLAAALGTRGGDQESSEGDESGA